MRIIEGPSQIDLEPGSLVARCPAGDGECVWLDLGADEEAARESLGEFWADPERAARCPKAQISRIEKPAREGDAAVRMSSRPDCWAHADSEEFRERAARAKAKRIGEATGAPRARRARKAGL